jgi:hypothetical protein
MVCETEAQPATITVKPNIIAQLRNIIIETQNDIASAVRRSDAHGNF